MRVRLPWLSAIRLPAVLLAALALAGRHLEPGEIKNAVCKVCGGKAEYRKQIHYFFRLSEFKDFLLSYLETLGGTASAPIMLWSGSARS